MRPPRINSAQADAVEEQRRLGRTDRQIEKIVGLASGTLSRPFLVDDSAQHDLEAARAASAERARREERWWAAMANPQRPQGWRPEHNCIADRPDAGKHFKPRRST